MKKLLGPVKFKGGVYSFPENGKWYVGKARNLYKRLRTHMNKGKLLPQDIAKIEFIHNPNAKTDADLFKMEDDFIQDSLNNKQRQLTNKIESPGKKLNGRHP